MNITILTVDTDHTRTLLNSKLEEQKHTVLADTNNYEEALKLYKIYLPDIIILDIDLGSTDKGLDFLNELLEVDPSAQVIALSSFFKDTTRAKLLRNGIDKLVMKPYQPAHIWEQIDYICEINDIVQLREKREKLINTRSSNNQSRGNQLNNQILSLRDQISKNRGNKTDETSNPSKQSINSFNQSNNSSSNSFSIDLEPIKEEKNSSLNFQKNSIDNHRTYRSDNYKDIEISLYDNDTQDNDFNYNGKDLGIYRGFLDDDTHSYKDENENNSYLGLPIFIDKEKRIDTNYNYDEYEEAPSSKNDSGNKILNKILKKKGGQ